VPPYFFSNFDTSQLRAINATYAVSMLAGSGAVGTADGTVVVVVVDVVGATVVVVVALR
jgi:hypothetical protein